MTRSRPVQGAHTGSTVVGVALVCALGAVGVLAWRDLQEVFRETEQMSAAIRQGFETISRLQFHAGDTRRTVLYALGTHDANEQVRFAQQSRAASADVDRVLSQPQPSPVALDDLRQSWDAYLLVRDEVIGLVLEGEGRLGVDLDLGEGTRLFERVERQLDGLTRAFEAHAMRRAASIDAQITLALGRVGLLWVAALAGILSTIGLYHRRRALDQRLEAEKRRFDLLEIVVDAVVSADEQDIIVEANSSAARMFGEGPGALVGRSFATLVSAGGQAPNDYVAPWLAARCADSANRQVEAQGRSSDSTVFPVELRVVAHRALAGLRYTAHMRDITSRRRAGDELRRAKLSAEVATRAKSEFIETISHEIRTPLNVLIGMTSLLADSPLTPDQRRWVAAGRVGGEAVLAVINNVLDSARLESGPVELDIQRVDVRAIVEGAIQVIALAAAQKHLVLERTIDASVPAVVAVDSTRLRQVLINLLGNAVKFTQAGRVVLCATAGPLEGSDDVMLRFEISDTGIGIPADQLARLFETFRQGDASTARRFGGSGLGLSISKRLAMLLGGDVDVESRQGEGSTFTFTCRAMVLANDDVDGARDQLDALGVTEAPGFSAELGSAHPLRVLVLDDDEASRKIAADLLARFGYHADLASNGTEALWATAATHYDLVLLDLRMPWPDGFEVARLIRSRAPAVALPRLVALTANVSDRDLTRSRAAGIDAYLKKPVCIDELRTVLTTTVSLVRPRGA